MSTPAHFARVGVLGVPVHAGSLTDAVDVVSTWIKDREPGYAVFRDVHGIMEARRRPDVLDAHEQAGLVACDGMPLVWAARRAGARDAERVCGHDFLMAFCARAEAEGWRSFLYGGKEGVPARVVEQLHAVFPELEIAGTYSPPFRPLTAAEDAGIIEMIDRSGADVVWVGLSTPKQELWMKEHVGRLAAPALLQRIVDLHAQLGKIAAAHLHRRHRGQRGPVLQDATHVVVREEERPVLLERPADAAPKLIQMIDRLGRGEVVLLVSPLVPEEVEPRPVKRIAPRLRDDVDHARFRPAVLR
jgi:N-acetylglucosaminyldiphosphoundecaprenol N-acetyl-beta-D-mannosaminyltransferase